MTEYVEYKDSGIPWIGNIPSHWDIRRGKNVLSLLDRPIRADDEVITCFRDGEVTLRKNKREDGFTVSLQEIGYQGIEPGDLVVHGMDGFAGSIGVSDSRGKATPVLNVMDSPHNKRFLMYYLRMAAYKDVFMSLSTGIRVRSCDLRWNKLSVFPFILPERDEQDKIAEFIDDSLMKIDFVIAEAKASIEEYKAWKASIIYEAVTKGLEPDVKMKDSGIEWIGTIPEYWKLEKLKRHTSMLTPMRDKPEHLDGEIPWVRIEDYCGKYIDASKEGLGVSSETVAKMNLKVYPVGTVLCTSSCDLGKCAIVSRPLVSNQRFIGIIPNANTCTDYLYYLMLSNAERLNYLSTGTIQSNLSRVAFEQLIIQIPPYNEQEEIASYLDKKMMQVDTLIFEKRALIKDLESYKKSLIFEVVTGKRRVC